MSADAYEFFATCAYGFESLLSQELRRLKVWRVRPLQGGVSFYATNESAYRVCLWSRLASRVLRVVGRVEAPDAETLYSKVNALPWETLIPAEATIAIAARGTNAQLRKTTFTALKVKDAVCDRLRAKRDKRPNVAPHRPDVPLRVVLRGNKATIYIDYAGEPLHKRGYRIDGQQVEAPLKETLAAAMLDWGGWREQCLKCLGSHEGGWETRQLLPTQLSQYQGNLEQGEQRDTSSLEQQACQWHGSIFYDPTCGSGTLVLEAAMMAADMAPGLLRDYWGFEGLVGYNPDSFDELINEAEDRLEQGLANMPVLVGSDIDPYAIELAQASAKRLGLGPYIKFVQANCADSVQTLEHVCAQTHTQTGVSPLASASSQCRKGTNTDEFRVTGGFIVCNPPYGKRLLHDDLSPFYADLSYGLRNLVSSSFASHSVAQGIVQGTATNDRKEAEKTHVGGWRMITITPDDLFDTALGFDAAKVMPCFNGALEVTLRAYDLQKSFVNQLPVVSLEGRECMVAVTSAHANQFAARLRKVAKARRKWARKNNIHAYRVYDADLPDYAVAVDVYEGCALNANGEEEAPVLNVVVTEYKAPREIDVQKAARRFNDACAIAQAVYDVSDEHLFTRIRKRDKGGSQYSKKQDYRGRHFQEEQVSRCLMLVEEGSYPFEVNLSSYLDTGLFLDHRVTRAMVGKAAEGKHFLNLFAYTGSASVYAAGAGALSTTTVDMSKTYLEWAKRNMNRAGFTGVQHHFVNADVLQWLTKQGKKSCGVESFNEQSGRQAVQKAKNLPQSETYRCISQESGECCSTIQGTQNTRTTYDVVFLDPPTFSNSKTMGNVTWDIQRDYLALLDALRGVLNDGAQVYFSGNLRSFKIDADALFRLGYAVSNITAQTIPEDFARNPKIHFCYLLEYCQ